MFRKILKWTFRGLIGLVALIVIAAVGLFFWLRTSQPELSGSVEVAGIEQPVTILRDQRGIPYIYARTANDAFFALGYVHAQDRLFQMEMQRRIGQGRLGEIIGSPGARFDRFMRTLGLYRRAKASLGHMSKDTIEALEAYAAGVNAWVRNRKGPLPPEFTLLDIDFEPWRPADTAVWGKLMALRLSGNWANELLRLRIVAALGAKAIPVLFPPHPGDAPVTIEGDRANLLDRRRLDRLWAAMPHALISKGASNEWVVGGARTKSGKPILANDPHLGLGAPILWYLAHVSAPGVTLWGATVPGTPAMIIGHNGHIAWGLTTTYIDSDDLFIERVDPRNDDNYLTPDGPKPFVTRTERIKVRFGKDIEIVVRETRHGPILDSFLRPGEKSPVPAGHVLALSAPWLSERDTTSDAFTMLARARNWNDFRAALSRYVGPLQNFVYADVQGNIGYYVPGLIPIRKKGIGFMPQPGWTGEFDWKGFIPFDELPQAFNPPSDVIVNANSKIAGKEYPYFLSREWGDHYRAQRIRTLLAATEKHTPQSIARIQADAVSLMALDLLPLMLKARPTGPESRKAMELLRKWDGAMALNRPEPLIFVAWLIELNRELYADELGPLGPRFVGLRADVVKNILTRYPGWCDNVRTPARETCGAVLSKSLTTVLARLRDDYGDDPALWRWGDAHYALFGHPVFRMIPGLNQLTRIKIATNGSQQTINKAAMNVRDRRQPYAQRHGPGYRGVYTFDNLRSSLFTIATGQSGNPYSHYYDNLVRDWRDVRHWRFARTRKAVEGEAIGAITLKPRPGGR